MVRDSSPSQPAGEPTYARPWILLGVGLVANGQVWLLRQAVGPDFAGWFFFGLMVIGGVALVLALSQRLRQAGWEWPDRIESAAMVSLVGLAAMVAYFGQPTEWGAARTFYAATFIGSLVASVLILLPSLLRRVAISLVVMFHFTGMLVAVTLVDPPSGSGPYLSKRLWATVYNPYLTFLYMTNAYHFYSPDPGAPSLLWFSLEYEDKHREWYKIPDRKNSPIGMHYQRQLALPEHSFAPMPRLPYNKTEVDYYGLTPERGTWEEILSRRLEASATYKIYQPDGKPMPFISAEQTPYAYQYREPNDSAKRILASVAKRVLWHEAPQRNGKMPVRLKMYRVIHQILTPAELADGMMPTEETKYSPCFMGEFDRDGKIMDSYDAMLYWYVPRVYLPKGYEQKTQVSTTGVRYVSAPLANKKTGVFVDGLEMHALGLKKKEDKK